MNLYIEKINNGSIIFRDNDKNKSYSRKVTSYGKWLHKFRYDNQQVWVLKIASDCADFSRPFVLDQKIYKNIHGWSDYKEAMKKLVDKYHNFKIEDIKVPSAPDTSKFYAVKRGDIVCEEKYYKRRQTWLSPFYFPIIVKVGSAVKDKLPQEFWNEYLSIIAGGLSAGLSINNKFAIPRGIFGSAWIAYGLAN